MPKTRILLADEHAVLRAGLRLLLDAQRDMSVVGEAGTRAETLRRIRETRADVVLTDLDLPGNGGEALIERIRRRHPTVKILVLTGREEVACARSALGAGAAGYVLKRSSSRQLLSAIRKVRRGGVFVSAGLTASNPSATRSPAKNAGHVATAVLSQRESEVLRLLARGHTNREIAERLRVGIKSVETYRSRLGLKLGLLTRAALVRHALETGLLQGR